MIGEWEQWQGGGPNPWPPLVVVVVVKNQEKKKPGTEQPLAYICFCKGHRQSGWAYSIKPWVLISPLHHQTPLMLTIALMVAQHLQLSCVAMLASCHLFSVRPEISPCTALENWVLHNMSCTPKKRKKKKRTSTIRLSKKSYQKSTQQSKFQQKKAMKNQPNWSKTAPLWGDDWVFKIRFCAGK